MHYIQDEIMQIRKFELQCLVQIQKSWWTNLLINQVFLVATILGVLILPRSNKKFNPVLCLHKVTCTVNKDNIEQNVINLGYYPRVIREDKVITQKLVLTYGVKGYLFDQLYNHFMLKQVQNPCFIIQ